MFVNISYDNLFAGISSSATHIRYHAGGAIWKLRSPLEKVLLLFIGVLLLVVLVLVITLHITEHRLQNIEVSVIYYNVNNLFSFYNNFPYFLNI